MGKGVQGCACGVLTLIDYMEYGKTEVEVINKKLPFEPVCPNCGAVIAIECGPGGYFAKCENCNNSWAAYRSEDTVKEMEWLEKFHNPDVKVPNPPTVPVPGPSDTKILMEIAHSSETLKKAYDLVCQAYDLINEDKVARQYIKFNAKVVWHQFVWDILMKQYNKDKPGNKDVYHLRAFDYYGIQPGMLVGDGEVEGN